MTITFQKLLSDCSQALGDGSAVTWSRVNTIWPWCIEAIQAFPILRPLYKDQTIAAIPQYNFDLPADFRQLISVEYPVSQTPPKYLVRKNRLDPLFYTQTGFYDVDHNYEDGSGWVLYSSQQLLVGQHVFIQYLGNHNTAMADDAQHFLSVPDEYETIIITGVMCRAYRERLSLTMQDPTAHTTVITQLTEMVQHVEELYKNQVDTAQAKLANSIVSPRQAVDKFDRVY